MKTVKEVLATKVKHNNIINVNTRVWDALVLFNSQNVSYAIVMDQNEFKGIFSERDYTRNVILKGKSSATSTVSEVMNSQLPTVSPDETLEHCMAMIDLYKTRYLPVIDMDKRFLGVITMHDIIREALKSKENVFDILANKIVDSDEGIF